MDWFTADQHFAHRNIIEYCNRPFRDENHMDREMVKRWNEVVAPADTVYVLGDFHLGIRAAFYFDQLLGQKIVVPGGHDRRWMKMSDIPSNVTIAPLILFKTFDRRKFTLCHYPMRSWEQSHHGAHHLHGHCHGTIGIMDKSDDAQLPPGAQRGKRLDVGVDNWNFYPINIYTILETLGE